RLHGPRKLALRAHDVADLDVVCGQLGRSSEQERPSLVGGLAALVARVEEPIPEELELEVVEPQLVEEAGPLTKRSGLEDVLEVGVPQPDAPEPDAGRLLAAVAEVEQAPLAPEGHFHRPRRGPVGSD